MGLPPSSDSNVASSSAFCSIRSASLSSLRVRSGAAIRPQSPRNALSAAATARSISSALPIAIVVSASPVDGSITALRSRPLGSIHFPSTNIRCCRLRKPVFSCSACWRNGLLMEECLGAGAVMCCVGSRPRAPTSPVPQAAKSARPAQGLARLFGHVPEIGQLELTDPAPLPGTHLGDPIGISDVAASHGDQIELAVLEAPRECREVDLSRPLGFLPRKALDHIDGEADTADRNDRLTGEFPGPPRQAQR